MKRWALTSLRLRHYILHVALSAGRRRGAPAPRPTARQRRVLCHTLPARLPPYHRQLHMLNLDPNQQEVDLPAYNVTEVVAPPLVLELDVEAILNSHLHFDWLVDGRLDAGDLNQDLVLLRYGREPLALHLDADEVFHRDVATVIRLGRRIDRLLLDDSREAIPPPNLMSPRRTHLVNLLHSPKVERNGPRVVQRSGGKELLRKRYEVVVRPPLVRPSLLIGTIGGYFA